MRALLLLAALPLGGCVERLVAVRTEPPGATLYVDGEKAGTTPCEVPYVFYGQREFVLELKEHRAVREVVSLNPPWWQIFPLDFITEVLVPVTITDRLDLSYVLERAPASEQEAAEVRKRAEELRRKVEPR